MLAIGVPSATGHPEERSTAAAWSSAATLTQSGDQATAGLELIASRSKPSPFNTESAFNSDMD